MVNYDKMAENYSKYRDIHPRVLENIISKADLGGESTVLEVGCGTGN